MTNAITSANQWEQDAAMGYSPSPLSHAGAAAAPANAGAERRAQWGAVLKGATLYTAMAVQARDWAKAQQGEELMATASGRGGLDSALLSAIFGGEVPALDLTNRLLAACYEAGLSASAEQVSAAREVVAKNKAAREAAARAKKDAEQAARAAESLKARAEVRDVRTRKAVENGLTVGALVDVTWTYKQARRDAATTSGGVVVECHGLLPWCAAGSGQARVKRVGGRLPVVELI